MKTEKNLTSYRPNVLTTENPSQPCLEFPPCSNSLVKEPTAQITRYSRHPDFVRTEIRSLGKGRSKVGFTLAEGATHVAQSKGCCKAAFTLAEVLITLGIIGVVAAMTIPGIIERQQEKVTVVKVQKAYNILSEALKMAMNEDNTIVKDWCPNPSDYAECSLNIANRFEKYLDVVKKCKRTDKKCTGDGWDDLYDYFHTPLYSVQNVARADYAIFYTKEGFMFDSKHDGADEWCSAGQPETLTWWRASYSRNCGFITVDINGLKGPNTLGKDVFSFKLVQNGIQGLGLKLDYIDAASFEAQCLGKKPSGKGPLYCSGWVLHNKNLDYLHCPDKLGWDKASSCKN